MSLSVPSISQDQRPPINGGQFIAQNKETEMPYSPTELQFIDFAKEIFRPDSNAKGKYVIFSPSDDAQSAFSIWMAKRSPMKALDEEDLNIHSIISSIWKKSQESVLVVLKERGTVNLIANEQYAQKEASVAQEKLQSNAKVFTPRQVRHLFGVAEKVRSFRSKL